MSITAVREVASDAHRALFVTTIAVVALVLSITLPLVLRSTTTVIELTGKAVHQSSASYDDPTTLREAHGG